MASGRRVAGANSSLVNDMDLQLECACSLTCMKHCLAVKRCYGKRRINLELWLYRWATSKDRVPNARIWDLCGVKKCLDERIDEGVLRWFGHVERMERDRIAKRAYVGECAGSRSVGRPWKRRNDTVKEC